jgi:hypothetical protein
MLRTLNLSSTFTLSPSDGTEHTGEDEIDGAIKRVQNFHDAVMKETKVVGQISGLMLLQQDSVVNFCEGKPDPYPYSNPNSIPKPYPYPYLPTVTLTQSVTRT